MNILFIEDDKDLQAVGVLQLEIKGHTVYPTFDLAESRVILEDDSTNIDLIICDHHLPDGYGIEFILEIREQFPDIQSAVVSGCLTPKNIKTLEEHNIAYFIKPFIYPRVLDEMRKMPSPSAPVARSPEPDAEGGNEAPAEPERKKKKKWFGLWPRK